MKLNKKIWCIGFYMIGSILPLTSCGPTVSKISLTFNTYADLMHYSASEDFNKLISKKPDINLSTPPNNLFIGQTLSKYMTAGDMTALMIQSLYNTWDLLNLSEKFQHPVEYTNINLDVEKLDNQSKQDRWNINISWDENDPSTNVISTRQIKYKSDTAPTWEENPNTNVSDYYGFIIDINTEELPDIIKDLLPPYVLDIDLFYRFFNTNFEDMGDANPFWDISVVDDESFTDEILDVVEHMIWPCITPWQWNLLFPNWSFHI